MRGLRSLQSCKVVGAWNQRKKENRIPYLKEIRDDHVNRFCLGPSIVNEKEVNHCWDSLC
jgi:hypothetical protein